MFADVYSDFNANGADQCSCDFHKFAAGVPTVGRICEAATRCKICAVAMRASELRSLYCLCECCQLSCEGTYR